MSTKGRKRNPKLDRAVEAVLNGVGVPLREALLQGGFTEVESSTKSVRDQLSRRLRNLRKEKEARALALGHTTPEPIHKTSSSSSPPHRPSSSSPSCVPRPSVNYLVQHSAKFLEQHRPVASRLDSADREAFISQFRDLLERESHAYSLANSFGRGSFSSTTQSMVLLPQPNNATLSTLSTLSALSTLNQPQNQNQNQVPPRAQPNPQSTPTLSSSSASSTTSTSNHVQKIPIIGGVPQTWVCNDRHVHTINCAHEAKRHRPIDGSAPHLDFLIRDGDKTYVECYGGVGLGNTGKLSAALPSTLCSCEKAEHAAGEARRVGRRFLGVV
ncbi:hypothetical protein TrLO_g3380 [Triparma laevis f. longispina]|uniref:Uncharacterized protein n=1 Tax=Triparma laevis f. longispina TaxID=1714387 RepID=A0A9W7EFM1_9STRA|nr:hypothetical protein TrLO_g3380 [Triparma laevis f. longispina]